MQPLLARMSPADLACSANLLLAVGHKPDADWQDRWMQAVDGWVACWLMLHVSSCPALLPVS